VKCPVCQTAELAMTSREGIEIDYCPQCRGVWLDRGELDKIIERSADTIDRDDDRDEHRFKEGKYYGNKPYKHKSVWKELFDF
jgi:uncharacterized protein